MREFVDQKAAALGVSRTELLRRLLAVYRKSDHKGLESPEEEGRREIDLVSIGLKSVDQSDPQNEDTIVLSEEDSTLGSKTEEILERQSMEIAALRSRIEALTAVSDLADNGSCPNCGSKLSSTVSMLELGQPIPIKCDSCGRVVAHQE